MEDRKLKKGASEIRRCKIGKRNTNKKKKGNREIRITQE